MGRGFGCELPSLRVELRTNYMFTLRENASSSALAAGKVFTRLPLQRKRNFAKSLIRPLRRTSPDLLKSSQKMRQNLTQPADSDSKITFNARFSIVSRSPVLQPTLPKSEKPKPSRTEREADEQPASKRKMERILCAVGENRFLSAYRLRTSRKKE
ncbi:hypothetical protein Trydic_g21407 [Trypoxylus dichotomus]